jgi:hypothetical protein
VLAHRDAHPCLLHHLGDGYAGVLAEYRRALRRAMAMRGGVEVDTQGMAPYATVGLDALPHAFVLALQVIVSAAVYVLRRGAFDARGIGAFALMGLAGVAYFDLLEIWFTLTWDHHYVPVSLAVVPLVSVALGAVLVLALRSISPFRAAAARKLESSDRE